MLDPGFHVMFIERNPLVTDQHTLLDFMVQKHDQLAEIISMRFFELDFPHHVKKQYDPQGMYYNFIPGGYDILSANLKRHPVG